MQEMFGLLVFVVAIMAAVKNPYRRDAEVDELIDRRVAMAQMKARLGIPLDWDDGAAIFAKQMR